MYKRICIWLIIARDFSSSLSVQIDSKGSLVTTFRTVEQCALSLSTSDSEVNVKELATAILRCADHNATTSRWSRKWSTHGGFVFEYQDAVLAGGDVRSESQRANRSPASSSSFPSGAAMTAVDTSLGVGNGTRGHKRKHRPPPTPPSASHSFGSPPSTAQGYDLTSPTATQAGWTVGTVASPLQVRTSSRKRRARAMSP